MGGSVVEQCAQARGGRERIEELALRLAPTGGCAADAHDVRPAGEFLGRRRPWARGGSHRCAARDSSLMDARPIRPPRPPLRFAEHEPGAGGYRRPRISGRVQQHDSELRDEPRAHVAAGARDLFVFRSVCRSRRGLFAGDAAFRRRPRAGRRAGSRDAHAVRGVSSVERRSLRRWADVRGCVSEWTTTTARRIAPRTSGRTPIRGMRRRR